MAAFMVFSFWGCGGSTNSDFDTLPLPLDRLPFHLSVSQTGSGDASDNRKPASSDSLSVCTLTVSLDTPSTSYAVRVTDVLWAGQEIWVIARVREGGIGGLAITRLENPVTASAPDLPVRIFLPGRR